MTTTEASRLPAVVGATHCATEGNSQHGSRGDLGSTLVTNPARPLVVKALVLSFVAHGALVCAFSGSPTAPSRPPTIVEFIPSPVKPSLTAQTPLLPEPLPPSAPMGKHLRHRVRPSPHSVSVIPEPASAPSQPLPSPQQLPVEPPVVPTTTDLVATAADGVPAAAAPTATGGGAEVGGKGTLTRAQSATSSSAHGSEFGDLNSYLGFLQERIGRIRHYPELAIRLRLEGVVEVRVHVNPDGTLAGPPGISSSSGHDILDQEALRMVARAAPFPAPPGGAMRATQLTVPVQFQLEE